MFQYVKEKQDKKTISSLHRELLLHPLIFLKIFAHRLNKVDSLKEQG